jgi:hypothetical protein
VSGWRARLAATFPSILRHEGRWTGIYTHLDAGAQVVDRHASEVVCEFPDGGDFAYVQRNRFTWPDGRTTTATLNGELRGDRLWWDAETFSGWAWETREGLILLDLERKDEPGARFYEIIVTAPDGRTRARTWHWFKDGQLYRRTLCDEVRA